EICVSPRGGIAVGTSTICDALEGAPSTRIVIVDLSNGKVRALTHGPGSDRLPKWSPDGGRLACLATREGQMPRLCLLDPETGESTPACAVDGWVEYYHWSADGRSVLLGVAGFGAHLGSGEGGISVASRNDARPGWIPEVDTGHHAAAWRSAWVYDL